jgi:hypothetical protein
MRRRRTRAPTCVSVGFGDLFGFFKQQHWFWSRDRSDEKKRSASGWFYRFGSTAGTALGSPDELQAPRGIVDLAKGLDQPKAFFRRRTGRLRSAAGIGAGGRRDEMKMAPASHQTLPISS